MSGNAMSGNGFEVIHVDILDKQDPAGWRVIGCCPAWVCESQTLYVYIGRPSRLLDATTDRVLLQARSLSELLKKTANTFGLPVVLTDEETGQVTRFEPRPVNLDGLR